MTFLYKTSFKHAFCTALSTAALLASALATAQLPADALVACEKPKWRSPTEPPKQTEIDAYNACRERNRQAKAALTQKNASGPVGSFAPCGEKPRARVSPYGVRTEPTWQEIAAYDAFIERLRAQSPAVAVPLRK